MIRTVLIVDDSGTERERMDRILSEAGLATLAAESGEAALRLAREQRPDLIFMDIGMPDMDGFAAARQLKADPATMHIPLVFVTGKRQVADRAWGALLGAAGYVTKPFTREQILAELEALA